MATGAAKSWRSGYGIDVTSVRVRGGGYAQRLVCHPRLPLVAGVDSQRPAVHVWDCGSGTPRELAVIGEGAPAYDAQPWERMLQTPSLAWHPQDARLAMTGEPGLRQWTPQGLSLVDGAPPDYRYIAYSPDGLTMWAFPSSSDHGENAWDFSDALDLGSGTHATTRGWDTGIVEHPGGGLLVTYWSDQGATLGLFARPANGLGVPAVLRVFRRALILDADGYESPIFSPDGRFLAIRGNAYGQSLTVFEFPSLHRVLKMWFVEPSEVFPYPPGWRERLHSWSRNNIAFARSSTLLVGTPRGTIAEVDLDSHRAIEHHVGDGGVVSSLAVLASGDLVVANRSGDLVLLTRLGESPLTQEAPSNTPRHLVEEFVATTSELPEDGDLESDLVVTDGVRTWEPGARMAMTTSVPNDPAWLQLQAIMNAARDGQA